MKVVWLSDGLKSILDQGLFAGTNFLVNIALAIHMVPSEYGAFSVAYTVFLVVLLVQNSVVIEPMLIQGPTQYSDNPRYYRFIQWGNFIGTALCGGSLFVAGKLLVFFELVLLGEAIAIAGLASPFLAMLVFTRRVAYALLRPGIAALSSAVYLLVMGLSTQFIGLENDWSITLAFAVLSISSVVASAFAYLLMRKVIWRDSQSLDSSKVVSDHWQYGKWSLVASVFAWIPGNVAYFLLPIGVGLQAVADFRAVQNLLVPMLHVNTALATAVLPRLSLSFSQGGARFDKRVFLVPLALSFVNFGILFFGGDFILEQVYSGKYSQVGDSLALAGLLPISAGFVAFLGTELRARKMIKEITITYVWVAILSGLTAFWLISCFSVAGAFASMILYSFVTAVLFYFHLHARNLKSGQE